MSDSQATRTRHASNDALDAVKTVREGLFERLIDPFTEAATPPPERLWPFMRWLLAGSGTVIKVLLIATLALGVAEAAVALAIGWVVDRAAAVEPEVLFGQDWPMLALIAAFFLIARPGLMAITTGLVSRTLNPGLPALGVWRLHGHTLDQSVGFFQDDFAGRIAQKETQTAIAMNDVVSETLNSVAFGLATLVAALGVLGAADWRLAVLLGIWFAFYLALVTRYLPRIRALAKVRAEARAGVSGQLVDSLSHMTTVKLFAHAGREREAAREALARYRRAGIAFGQVAWSFRTRLAILSSLLPVVLCGAALWLWSLGEAGPGLVAMAGMLSMRLSHMSGWISFTAMAIFTNVGVIEDGMKTLAPPHTIVDSPDAAEPEPVRGEIRFEGVEFRYGREEGGGLNGLDLTIRPGERVGLVGRSGAGKSTTLAALLRLHEIEGGRITLDGADIRSLTQDGLRRQIATVTQDPAMFNRSALDNILYGRPKAGREAAHEAAKQAHAHDFIEALRDQRGRTGYDAHLGEDGVKLSGGQRQRIALARAILKDAPVLLLDEATSALDSEVEAEIQDSLKRLMHGKTVIAIAHRLSTIQSMDRIVVLDEGRVIEQGPHAELLRHGGLYARLWERQSGGFLDVAAE
ncbi:MAG: ABC transporter ATP-binding protein [Pseudomonadota bacterium]